MLACGRTHAEHKLCSELIGEKKGRGTHRKKKAGRNPSKKKNEEESIEKKAGRNRSEKNGEEPIGKKTLRNPSEKKKNGEEPIGKKNTGKSPINESLRRLDLLRLI